MKARAKLMDQARKALYCLYRKLRNISIPIDLQFKLLDTLILPILTYGSEIWGYENTKQLEKLHLQFCRNILGVRTTTPNFMTYGELDRTPIDTLCIKLRPSVECYKECSIFRKAKGAREARKETLTLELNANVS